MAEGAALRPARVGRLHVQRRAPCEASATPGIQPSHPSLPAGLQEARRVDEEMLDMVIQHARPVEFK